MNLEVEFVVFLFLLGLSNTMYSGLLASFFNALLQLKFGTVDD